MQPEERDQRITIRRKVSQRDETTGAESPTWPDWKTVWAKASPLRGREYVQMAQTESEVEVVFNVHYQEGKDITPDSRIVWRGVVYELDGPPIDVRARKQEIELMCRSSQNA